jgi:hypothetical protein
VEGRGEGEVTDVLQYSYLQFTTNATDHDLQLHVLGQPRGHLRAVSVYETKLLIAVSLWRQIETKVFGVRQGI